MKVAAIQMVSGADRDANLACARDLLAQARAQGAELAVLPEYFCLLGRDERDKLRLAVAPGAGAVQDFLAASARELGLWIVGGTLPLRPPPQHDDGRARNSTLVYDASGRCVARYDKIHLFRFDNGRERYDEARTLQPGGSPVTFELPSRDGHRWRVGLSVCYDLRFPELYRQHAQAGADLLLVPSAFTYTTGQAHWEVLLRARAIENQAYVLAPAQGGRHETGRRTWGHSMLVDAWGSVQALQAQGPGLVVGTLDAQHLQQVRAQLPALTHRVLK